MLGKDSNYREKINNKKKVISFSLWGDKPIYNIGAIRNAITAKEVYPDFECWFYIHKESVPQKTIDELNALPNTKIKEYIKLTENYKTELNDFYTKKINKMIKI